MQQQPRGHDRPDARAAAAKTGGGAHKLGAALLAVSGLVMAASAFLEWAGSSTFGDDGATGIDVAYLMPADVGATGDEPSLAADGYVAILLGVLALIFGVSALVTRGSHNFARVLGLLCAIGGLVFTFLEYSRIDSDFGDPSTGLFVLGGASVLALVGAILLMTRGTPRLDAPRGPA